MIAIMSIAILSALAMYLCLQPMHRFAKDRVKETESFQKNQEKKIGFFILGIVMFLAFLIRIIGAVRYKGYEIDINCFLAWADMVFENGFGEFYKLNAFTDYPPGYMYVLFVIGAIRSLFHIPQSSVISILLTKLPAILADLGTGWLIYKIALKRFQEKGAVMVSAMFLFAPAIILDSAVWAQVDSVFTFFIVLMCYFITEKKLIPAYFVFAIGILIKPQSMMFGPVLIFGIIDQVFIDGLRAEFFDKKQFWKNVGINLFLGIMAILLIGILMIPFGFQDSLKQYTETMSSYPYASVNAYNFWTMIGKNWADQNTLFLGISYKIWGIAFIVCIIATAGYINFTTKERKSKYYFLGAFILCSVFTLSVRMHERYIYPAVVLLLLSYAARPRKKIFLGYLAIAAIAFLNMSHSMFYFDPKNFKSDAPFPILVSVLMVGAFIYLIYIAFVFYKDFISEDEDMTYLKLERKRVVEKKREEKNMIQPTKQLGKIVKTDLIAIAIITIVYAIVAFANLGNKEAPTTSYSFAKQGAVLLDFGKEVEINKIWDYLGYQNNPKYKISYSKDENAAWVETGDGTKVVGTWQDAFSEANPWDAGAVFCWNDHEMKISARYVRIAANAGVTEDSIQELVFTDKSGNTIVPVNANKYKNLFDEQKLFDGRKDWKSGTYFDEIYHARTAYEMIHHLYCYENTHPPLGKGIMALGILIFGMNPFGWRFMGTLFGVLMLPLFYLFSKRIFKKSWLSIVTTILFAADFMHFTQTRIATIDVFVTFFIILAYYFMYCYTQKSFYDSKLIDTFIPLGLCGIAMGLSWASKWTGIYASGGLCVLFFMSLGQRFREYLYAVKHPEGVTEGISHMDIVNNFYKKCFKTIGFCCIFFVVIPAIIYVLAYIPMNDGTDHGLLRRVLDNQSSMYNYHSSLTATHPYSSKWYEWPVMKRPIWYFSGEITPRLREGISAFGNPLVWWMGIPAFLMVIYLAVMANKKNCRFLSIAYLSQYLPWVFIGRVVFIYHYFPSVPFVVLMIGYCMNKIVEKKPKLKVAMFVYAGLAVVLFVMFYPVISGTPVNPEYVRKYLKWCNDWVLIQTW